MASLLLPRASKLVVDSIVDRLQREKSPKSMDEVVRDARSQRTFAATGGRKVSEGELEQLKATIHSVHGELASGSAGPAAVRAEFDARCAAVLASSPLLGGGEALRDDVWSYLTAVLLWDMALWRFQNAAPERFHGGVRNAFQRLWQRGRIFDRGAEHPDRWQLVRSLTEDAFVQILERPSLASSPRLSKAIAEGWLRHSASSGRSQMENTMRRAVRNLRISNQVIMLDHLPDLELDLRIGRAFEQAAANGR
jgi:hypothetical protein